MLFDLLWKMRLYIPLVQYNESDILKLNEIIKFIT